jgi:hypothetical protein
MKSNDSENRKGPRAIAPAVGRLGRTLLLALAVAGGVGMMSTSANAALYCHRGPVFLHWGPCAQDAWRFGYYRPYYHHARWHLSYY